MRSASRRRSGLFSPLERIGLGIEQMLRPSSSSRFSGSRSWVPEVRVFDRPHEFIIRLISPEVDPRRIRIELTGRTLRFSAATADPEYHAFRRSILLPETADWRQLSARAGRRILTLRIPKQTG
jgi:HSP20 family molecular chaperone IbpA